MEPEDSEVLVNVKAVVLVTRLGEGVSDVVEADCCRVLHKDIQIDASSVVRSVDPGQAR